MRTPLLAGLIAVLIPACLANEITGVGEDDGDDLGSGSGSGSGSDDDIDTTVPRVDMTVDKPSIDTELRTSHEVTVTLTSVNDFTGPVTLSASAIDATSAALAGWTTSIDTPTVNLTAGGTATAVVTFDIPTRNSGLTGSLKIDAASSAAPATVSSAINVANQITFNMSASATACSYPTTYGKAGSRDIINVGTKIRWFNTGANNFEIHIGGGESYGFSHQGQAPTGQVDGTTEPNTAYEQTATAVSGGGIQWYCHQPSDSNNANYGQFEIQ